MNIAVTGGSGFVGTHLIHALIHNGHNVRVFLRKSTDTISGATYFKGDLFSESDLLKFFSSSELLINLIGRFDPPFEEQMESNVIGLFHLLNSASKSEIKKIIHVSAAAVYGDASVIKSPKETDAPEPSTPYGLSKLLGEETVRYCARKNNLDYIILRPTNIYSSDARAGVLASMRQSWLENGLLSVTGDGRQVRDFIHVEDLVSAILLMIDKKNNSDIYNIASGEAITINDVANIFKRFSEKTTVIDHIAAPSGYVRALRADNSLLMNEYGWKPRYNVAETVAEMLK